MDDDRFEEWWQAVASPQVENHWLTRQYADRIKQGAKQVWDAALAWHPPQPTERD